jgi:hypothetical protein
VIKPVWRASRGLSASVVLLGLLVATPLPARAAPCCVSATSFGVGRLLIWEDFATGLQLSHARILGEWDQQSRLRRNPAEYSEGLSLAQPWAILRLHQRIELQGWVPILVNDRWSGDVHQVAGGVGDVGMASRFQVLGIGEYQGLPSFAVTVGGIAPAGRRVEQTSPPLFAGTTGRGTWGGSLAIETEVAHMPWFVRLEAALTAFAPFTRPDTHQRQQYGPLATASLSSGREIVPDRLVAALALIGEWQSRITLDDQPISQSQAHLYSLAASLSWRTSPHLTLVGVVTNSVWPDGFGMNRDARLGFTLGVRYGYF